MNKTLKNIGLGLTIIYLLPLLYLHDYKISKGFDFPFLGLGLIGFFVLLLFDNNKPLNFILFAISILGIYCFWNNNSLAATGSRFYYFTRPFDTLINPSEYKPIYLIVKTIPFIYLVLAFINLLYNFIVEVFRACSKMTH